MEVMDGNFAEDFLCFGGNMWIESAKVCCSGRHGLSRGFIFDRKYAGWVGFSGKQKCWIIGVDALGWGEKRGRGESSGYVLIRERWH